MTEKLASRPSTPSNPAAHTCTSTLPLGTWFGGGRYEAKPMVSGVSLSLAKSITASTV
ncbi:hypothetical protein M413DRAFT_444961 [Hebeloma cylindrosporum]|uniref:Uncharacterized protein n=1 Tax=Hebeloma cylindrosporum TaxID=76867 RepID=A0A0C3CDQ0_HEBCY|nr:hypothetical protein M413DRAFT_444961 [Hebeloma cylindrosporum h7]